MYSVSTNETTAYISGSTASHHRSCLLISGLLANTVCNKYTSNIPRTYDIMVYT